jgi:hypothetical protein
LFLYVSYSMPCLEKSMFFFSVVMKGGSLWFAFSVGVDEFSCGHECKVLSWVWIGRDGLFQICSAWNTDVHNCSELFYGKVMGCVCVLITCCIYSECMYWHDTCNSKGREHNRGSGVQKGSRKLRRLP